ncbi:hypothetical protein Rs2_23308 [Raphanus sativus]|nr:hypothetical protein Rs2_23308 [Raphanus sativus]
MPPRMYLEGGMFLKGVSKNVEVDFLTLFESLNFCKVGQNLKWPIWVIGSESHYTFLFALDLSVQEENKFELRVSQIRRAFDARDPKQRRTSCRNILGFHVPRAPNLQRSLLLGPTSPHILPSMLLIFLSVGETSSIKRIKIPS